MQETVTTTTTKGIIISLVLIVISIAMYFANVDMSGPLKWVGNVVFVIGIVWSVSYYGKQVSYNSTFGNYFAHGFKITAVVTSIMTLYLVIFILLFPEFKEKGIEQARISMQQNPKMTPEQINQGLEITRKFFMVFVIGASLIFNLIFGSLAALVGAAITKKDPNALMEINNQPLQ